MQLDARSRLDKRWRFWVGGGDQVEPLIGSGSGPLLAVFGEQRRVQGRVALLVFPCRRVFERVSAPTDRDDVRTSGCLMVNTGFEIDEPAEEIADELTQYGDLWRSTFLLALEADQIADAETRSEFLVGALWGALSQIRLASDTAAAQPMTSVVIETVRGWTHSD